MVLALAVVASHCSRLAIGRAAVYVFFILSGYWITAMWRDRYSKTRAPYVTFSVSRAWRLIPVFIAGNAFAWAVEYTKQGALSVHGSVFRNVISNIGILGYSSLGFQANPPAWSLDIEVQFYIVVPLMTVLYRWGPRALLLGAAVSILACLGGDAVTFLPYIIFFSIGGVAAMRNWRPRAEIAWLSLVSTAITCAICLVSPYRDILIGRHDLALYQYNNIASAILACLLSGWAVYTTSVKAPAWDKAWGDLSYIVYLVHAPVLALIDTTGGSHAARLLRVVMDLAITGVLSWVLWRYVDRPLNRFRQHWVGARISTSASKKDEVQTPTLSAP